MPSSTAWQPKLPVGSSCQETLFGHRFLEDRRGGGIFLLGVGEEYAAAIMSGVHPVLVLASSLAP